MERNIDSMKYRKSTHLSGVDVQIIIAEKGECILTIKDAHFDKGVNVSGNKTDGYFLVFKEDVKPMMVNSGNRKIISRIVKDKKKLSDLDSRNIGQWIGLTIELDFDPKRTMMGKVTGGIAVKEKAPEAISEKDLKVLKGKIAACIGHEQLTALYNSSIKFKTSPEAVSLFKEKNHELTTAQ